MEPHAEPNVLPEERAVPAQAKASARKAAVTLRAVALGLLGAVQVAIIQVSTKVRPTITVPPWVSAPYISWYAILPGAIFWLFLVAVLNVGIKRWRPHAALRPSEFAVIFGMTTVAASISAMDEVMNLLPTYVYPFRASQEESMGPFRSYVPHWFVPHDSRIVEPYYLGSTSFWTAERLSAWAVPLLCWMSYLIALGATMWAWNVILRRRWIDGDRLAFPNVQLPLEMCRSAGFGGALSGNLFWIGLAAAATFESVAHLHQKVPAVPTVSLVFVLTPWLDAAHPPWNALSPMEPMWSPLHLALCYFVPADILFSAGFFYLFRKGLEVFGRAMGWRELGWDAAGFPHSRAQAAGAWGALFFLLLWAERHHLWRVLTAAFRRRPEPMEDAGEPGSYRWAGRILVGGTLYLLVFSIAGGMSPGIALAYYAVFWMLTVTATRIYCQVGPPVLELYFLHPQHVITTVFGTYALSPSSAIHLSLMNWLNRTNSGHPMAHQMVAFYVGKHMGVNMRSLSRWVFVAFIVGAMACLLAYLHYAYRVGEDQWVQGGWRESGTPAVLDRMKEWVNTPKGPQWDQIGFIAIGAAFTLALSKACYLFVGFPFHPVGFALAMCYGVEYTWPSFLFMWLFKGLTLRYGGLGQYRRCVPFFLGLALGGLVTPVCWGFVAWMLGWHR